jgi:hypothetical protein
MVDFDYVIVGAGAAGCVRTSAYSAFVLPVQVAGNTQAPAMAVAWIAAGLIHEDSQVRR